jgi:hypothetical protein
MARVLLISNLPPQLIAGEKVEASHYRAWQFLHGMLADGHDVHLCACLLTPEEGAASQRATADNAFDLAGLDRVVIGAPGWISRVQRTHDEFHAASQMRSLQPRRSRRRKSLR